MLIASYNPQSWGDVLVAVVHEDAAQQKIEKKGNIVCIKDADSGVVLGYNFFNVSSIIGAMNVSGQVKLEDKQLAALIEHWLTQVSKINWSLMILQNLLLVLYKN
ncbi:phenylalanyl-tRNA synthetase domain protein [Liquorilactobacillus sucicola DSM 21376 = JCM 15457]|nr:phenylalanyl-tRNA synthetase domain protein [Liquorilactobacillus sucicola DSM 21376 = JCM 15457]